MIGINLLYVVTYIVFAILIMLRVDTLGLDQEAASPLLFRVTCILVAVGVVWNVVAAWLRDTSYAKAPAKWRGTPLVPVTRGIAVATVLIMMLPVVFIGYLIVELIAFGP